MCDEENYEALEGRVDEIDQRLTRVETRQNEQTQMMRDGFADVKTQLCAIYSEKAKWGEWARNAMTRAGEWFAKWGTIIIIAAIGMGNGDKIGSFVMSLFK